MVQGKAILPYWWRTVLSLCPYPSCLISALFGPWRSRNILLANRDPVEAWKPSTSENDDHWICRVADKGQHYREDSRCTQWEPVQNS